MDIFILLSAPASPTIGSVRMSTGRPGSRASALPQHILLPPRMHSRTPSSDSTPVRLSRRQFLPVSVLSARMC